TKMSDPTKLPKLFKRYYQRLFPYSLYCNWLNYSSVVKNYSQRYGFFTLKDDIYIRYQSFNNQSDLEKEMQKMNPYKIDTGTVYSHRPNQHNTVNLGAFQAQEKELVFDTDMTDYDNVRRCCSSADTCSKCCILMTTAICITDTALREDFGFKHRLWVYSRSRGVYCWVCDIRKLSSVVHSGIVEYLSLVKHGQDVKKKVQLTEKIHPFVRKSINIIKNFEDYAFVNQDILKNNKSWDKILALVPQTIQVELQQSFQKSHNSLQHWVHQQILKMWTWLEWEIMLQDCPRRGINVSKEINHLPKSPFSVHPKTGHISVPTDLQKVDRFDPLTVLTINLICHELDASSTNEEKKGELAESDIKYRTRDCKTSLVPYVKVFEQFLENLERELLKKSDLQKDF
uniref:DNA primase n=1 Tax=Chlorocebus sabaeus TaxID=60711 RepID=A0A0D9R9K0_CHLSB